MQSKPAITSLTSGPTCPFFFVPIVPFHLSTLSPRSPGDRCTESLERWLPFDEIDISATERGSGPEKKGTRVLFVYRVSRYASSLQIRHVSVLHVTFWPFLLNEDYISVDVVNVWNSSASSNYKCSSSIHFSRIFSVFNQYNIPKLEETFEKMQTRESERKMKIDVYSWNSFSRGTGK